MQAIGFPRPAYAAGGIASSADATTLEEVMARIARQLSPLTSTTAELARA